MCPQTCMTVPWRFNQDWGLCIPGTGRHSKSQSVVKRQSAEEQTYYIDPHYIEEKSSYREPRGHIYTEVRACSTWYSLNMLHPPITANTHQHWKHTGEATLGRPLVVAFKQTGVRGLHSSCHGIPWSVLTSTFLVRSLSAEVSGHRMLGNTLVATHCAPDMP